MTCIRGRTSLCIWPEHEKYLPLLRRINARIDALPVAFLLPPRMNEFGIERTWYLVDGPHGPATASKPGSTPEFSILEGSRWSVAGDLATDIMGATFNFENAQHQCTWRVLPAADNARELALDAWMESYLAGGGNPDYHSDAPAEMHSAFAVGLSMAARASLAEQFSWAEREVNDLHGRYCQR